MYTIYNTPISKKVTHSKMVFQKHFSLFNNTINNCGIMWYHMVKTCIYFKIDFQLYSNIFELINFNENCLNKIPLIEVV